MIASKLRVLSCALGCMALASGFIMAAAVADRDGSVGFVYHSSDAIADAQARLVEADYLQAGSFKRGEMDAPTVKAVLDFQRYHNLPQTGLVDWETMSLLPQHAGAPRHAAPAATPRPAPAERDSDGDGVMDGQDKCPNTPQGARVDSSGCPLDSDGDGVYDGLDRCPGTPHGETVDSRGCPLDSDGDGVTDGSDRCPDTPRGTRVDAQGCPEPAKPAPLFEGTKKTLVLEGVNFETNSAKLTAASHAVLDRVASSLNDSPEVRVEVAGHTDSMGSDDHNMKLSAARAESVKSYLVGRGVAASRLVARGYGETKPVADNGTAAGRAKNRRVELTKID